MLRASVLARSLLLLLAGHLTPFSKGQHESVIGARRLLSHAPGEAVSIYDGVLPSPELGPQLPVQTIPAPALSQQLRISLTPEKTGMHCGPGCIAGSVIGGTVGLALLLGLLIYCCCRRQRTSVKDDGVGSTMSTSDLELLDNQALPAQSPAATKIYSIGENVFCRKGRNCTFGKVLAADKGDKYTVEFYDGNQGTVKSTYMAPNFTEGTEVWYSPPDGRPSVRGTVIQADGSYWPPFYQLTPHGGNVDLVNTTADCLVEAKQGAPAHFITAKAG